VQGFVKAIIGKEKEKVGGLIIRSQRGGKMEGREFWTGMNILGGVVDTSHSVFRGR
jgi:hypothetical protein